MARKTTAPFLDMGDLTAPEGTPRAGVLPYAKKPARP